MRGRRDFSENLRATGLPRRSWRPIDYMAIFMVFVSLLLIPVVSNGENLVRNGDFEEGRHGVPEGWDKVDGKGVFWGEAPGRVGLAIRLDTSVSERDMQSSWERAGLTNRWSIPKPAGNAIADTYGLSYYSTNFPCRAGESYRVSCDTMGAGAVKVWVRGYGEFRGRRVRRYEAVMNVPASPGKWRTTTMDFNPTARRPEVDELRVMLYVWYPPGEYWFDNICVEAIP